MTSRDDMIKEIQELESLLNTAIDESQEQRSEMKLREQIKIDKEKELRRVQEELAIKAEEYKNAIRAYNNKASYITQTKQQIAKLKRDLNRRIDSDRINEEYLSQLEKFKDACLDAVWRQENRTDGLGAFEYQIEGAIKMAAAKSGVLGDRRGLGKSLTSLVWADLLSASRVIAISPSDTMDNFIREIQMWAPHRMPVKLGKLPKGQRKFLLDHLSANPNYILILNYEAWRKDATLIDDLIRLNADTLILDESHNIKTFSTATAKGVFDLRFGFNICPGCDSPDVVKKQDKRYAHCKNCEYEGEILDFCSIKNVLSMTGTPILNKPQELAPQLMLTDPMSFTSISDFVRDFCYADSPNRWTWKYGAEQRLLEKIGPRFIARDRKTAGVIVPPNTSVIHKISLDDMRENYPDQYKAYTQVRDNAELLLDPDRKIAMSMPLWISVLLRLRQVLAWPAGIVLKEPNEEGDMIPVATLNVYESIKLDKAESLIRELNEENERVILFSQFKDPLHELASRLNGPVVDRTAVYDGSTPDHLRNFIQKDFDIKTVDMSNTRYDNVLCNYRSGGVGLNFNAASHMIILDREWNPGKEDQAIGRMDRIGQRKETTTHFIEVENSIDTWMSALLEDKSTMLQGFDDATTMQQRAFEALRNGEL